MMFPLEVTVCADNLKDSVRGLEVLSKESKLSRSSLRAFGGITGAISPAGAHTLLWGCAPAPAEAEVALRMYVVLCVFRG